MAVSRFAALDGLRGLAALVVVLYHLGQIKLTPQFMPRGYLAVDFFFMLSGVVVAHAYEAPLGGGLTAWEIMNRRLIRMYPLAAAGAALGFLVLLLKHIAAPEKVEPTFGILLSGALNLFLLPDFWGGAASRYELFPGNGPLWSLFFELAVNLAWVLILRRRHTGFLIAVLVVTGLLLTKAILSKGSANIGWDQNTFFFGFPRVLFGFTMGIVINRSRRKIPCFNSNAATFIISIGLIAAFSSKMSDASWDVVFIFILIPIAVLFASAQNKNPFGDRLGDLSYPLYSLHFPILLLASGFGQKYVSKNFESFFAICAASACVAASWGVLKLFDEPVRATLMKRVRH